MKVRDSIVRAPWLLNPWLLCLLLACFLPMLAWADDEEETPPPAVRLEVKELPWAQVLDAVLPGRVLDVAPWPDGLAGIGSDGPMPALAVLLRPEKPASEDEDETADDAPPQLLCLRGGADDLQPVIDALPEDVDSLHVQGDALWLGEEGTIYRLESSRQLTPLLQLEGIRLNHLVRRGLIHDDRVLIPEVGSVRHYTADLQPTDVAFPLPVEARRRSRRIELQSPPMRRLDDDGTVWVSDPETVDAHRVRVHWIDLDAPEDEQLQESWLRFAEPEDGEQFHYTHIDGRPALLVATTRGDKLGIFEKLKFRTFLLKSDRTRAGRLPRAHLETVTRNWYDIDTHVVDFDGNGKDDLLLLQPDGLGAGSLLVELHLGRGSGLLEPRSRRSKIKGEAAGWDMSADFTGDGVPDLLMVSEGELSIYPALPKHKRKVVDTDPLHRLGPSVLASASVSVSISIGEDGSEGQSTGLNRAPRLESLDNDPAPELVLLDTVRGRSVVRVVDLKSL